MKVAVLVPRRADGGRRDELWRYVEDRWHRDHPEWPLIEGHHLTGPFNRAAAINAAADHADELPDVYVIADADTFAGADQVRAMADTAAATARFTIGYDRYCYLGRPMSDRILEGYAGDWWPGVDFYIPGTCSCLIAVPRELFERVGGFDEGFVGWGGEDVAFSLACQTLADVQGLDRVPGDLWHLWHAPAHHTHDHIWPARLDRYDRVAYNRAAMAELLDELHDETGRLARL